MAKNSLASSPDAPKRRRKRMMSDAEVITILICFHFNTYRNFKHYYLSCVCGQWRHLFPRRFSYNRFVEIMPRCFVALTMFLRLACFGECTGISFVDSTCIPVIHNKREFNMKVCKGIAAKGKSSIGWYVGIKLHLLCNEKGELVNFVLTRANADDREVSVIDTLTDKVFGKLYADKGYISQSLFGHLWDNGVHIVTGLRSNMKQRLMPLYDKIMLRVNNAFALAGRFIAITNPGQRPGLCAFGPSARISPVGRPAPSLYLHILHGTHHKSCGATGSVCETAS